jgi:hypothetical protein
METKFKLTAKEVVQKLEEKKVTTLRDGALWRVRRAAEGGSFSCVVPIGAYMEDLGFVVTPIPDSDVCVRVNWSSEHSNNTYNKIKEITERARRIIFRDTREAILKSVEDGQTVVKCFVTIYGSPEWYERELKKNGFNASLHEKECSVDHGQLYEVTIKLADPLYVK